MRDALGLPSLVVDLWILKSHARVLLHHGHGGREHRVPGRHGGADALLVLVPELDLVAVLGLHARAHRAVHHVRDGVHESRRVPQARLDEAGNVAHAGQTLEGDHGVEQAVIALGVLQLHLVLEQVPGRQNRVRETAAHLEAQASLRAGLLLHASGAWQEPLAARVEPHVAVQGLHTVLVRNAGRAPDGEAAKEGRSKACLLHLGLPGLDVLPAVVVHHLPLLHLLLPGHLLVRHDCWWVTL
mmetsp:Transcript_9499/g.32840  ORF Transcript_9499/g.32840 Transcript_9499/m.32840 type:complete len:242 (+) Transcript_9499:1780-2505(+)